MAVFGPKWPTANSISAWPRNATQLGEKLTIRVLDPENSVRELEELGLRKSVYDQIREVIRKPHGLVLVAGPAGSGKSTTLHAALNDLDTEQQNVIAIEDPVEYRMESITQIEIRTSRRPNFCGSPRNVLRQDPDVLMVGEIRDGETAQVVCQAAHTGHFVFSTLHANDSIAALLRMLELGAEPSLLADTLSLVLAQRLVRRLCPKCREEFQPKPEELVQAGLPAEGVNVLYRAGTGAKTKKCPACRGTGYYGQVGVFEVLAMTEELRDSLGKPDAHSATPGRPQSRLIDPPRRGPAFGRAGNHLARRTHPRGGLDVYGAWLFSCSTSF